MQSAALCLKALRCDNGGLSLSLPSGEALGTVGCFGCFFLFFFFVVILFGDNSLEDWCSAIEFLVEKGYLKEHKDNFEITYAGKAFIHDGGFVGKDRRNRILSYCTIIAAISSVLALVVSLIALICQLCG